MLERLFRHSDRAKLRCAVITPIGPGHAQTYAECESSIRAAWRKSHGPFSALELLPINDSAGLLGRSLARNQGVQKAAAAGAEWIFFLDADDVMLPDAFGEVGDYVEHYDAVWGLIASRAFGAAEHHLRIPQILSINQIESLLVFDPFLTLQMGHFVRTSAALATPFDDNLNAGEDFDYYLRLWRKYRCTKVIRSFFVARQGRRSQGPRSASAEDWGSVVRGRLAQERAQHGLDASSAQTVAIKNAAVRDLQSFYRERGLADASNYLALSRELPYRGVHRIECFGAKPFEMYSDNDDLVCLSLAWTGEYLNTTTRLWQTLASSARIILDIGAGTGFWGFVAERAASPESRIYCLEPLADNYERLRNNITGNATDNITPLHAAVGQPSGSTGIRAFVSDGLLSSRTRVLAEDHSATRLEHVPVISIDDMLREHGGHVDLARIDAAGEELSALAVMASVIVRNSPDLVFECARDAPLSEIDRMLSAASYRQYAIDEELGRLALLDPTSRQTDSDRLTFWATARSSAEARSLAEACGIEVTF